MKNKRDVDSAVSPGPMAAGGNPNWLAARPGKTVKVGTSVGCGELPGANN
jgi:hypothetical protein